MKLLRKRLANTGYAIRYYKKPILIIMLITVIVFCTLAFCAGGGSSRTENVVTNKKLFPKAEGMTISVMDLIDDLCGVSSISSIENKVAILFDKDSSNLMIGGKEINNVGILTATSDIFTGIAFCFVTLTFFMSFMAVREMEITTEELIKKIALFAVCIVLVFQAQRICLDIANIGTGIASKVSAVAQEQANEQADLIFTVKNAVYQDCHVAHEDDWFPSVGETLTAVGYYLQLFIPSLAMWASSLIVSVTCWSRAFEVLILSTFSPLAFADASDIDHQFGRGSGARFVKNVMALALSGAVIIFIVALTTNVSTKILMDALTSSAGDVSDAVGSVLACMGDLLVIGFAQCGLVLKAQGISKTICGVG